MEVDFAFLCDYAESPGKLYALGIGFDQIFAASVPALHPVFYAVCRLRFSAVEYGPKTIGIRILDADANTIAPPIDATVQVEPPPPPLTERTVTIPAGLHGITFPRYGLYAVVFLMGGNEIARLPFRVTQPLQRPPTA